MLQTIQRVLLGDHATTKQAVEAFVKAVLAPRAATKRTKTDDRELELLNRKIKATVAMLADPTFDGLDELRTTLADLKARRDALATRLKPVDQPATPAITEDELRRWALAQFARLDDLATRTTVDLQDRQMVEAFVQRIEINPEAKMGEIILIADLSDAFREGSTREPIGDPRAAQELRRELHSAFHPDAPRLRDQAFVLIETWRRHLPASILIEEVLDCDPATIARLRWQKLHQNACDFFRWLRQHPERLAPGLPAAEWFRGVERRLSESTGRNSPVADDLAQIWGVIHRDDPQAVPPAWLKPEEVTALPPDVAITFVPGLPPICTRLLRYYEEPALGHVPRTFAEVRTACRTLVAALGLLVLCVCSAILLTVMASHTPGF